MSGPTRFGDLTPRLVRAGTTLATVLVATVMLAGPRPATTPQGGTSWLDKLTPNLVARLGKATGPITVIVTFAVPSELAGEPLGSPARQRFTRITSDELASDYAPLRLELVRRFDRLPMAVLRVPAGYLDILASDPRVATVEPDLPVHAMRNNGRDTMSVPEVAALGFDGTGIGVAVIDTGVDYRHDELKPGGTDASAKTIKLADTIANDDDPLDEQGHGTSVAGVVGGVGMPPSILNPIPSKGVAPNSRVVAVRVLNAEGSSENGSVGAGLDKVVASVLAGNPYNIKVVNLSLGGIDEEYWPPHTGTCDHLFPSYKMAFDTLTDAGVVVVAAAGNEGCSGGVGYPACVSSAMAIGAVYNTAATARPANGEFITECTTSGGCQDAPAPKKGIACYSNSGDKLSAWAPSDATVTPRKTSATNTSGLDYSFAGTSCAAPYVAGVAALLFHAVPAASPLAVRNALETTGEPITDTRNGYTRNLVNAAQALQRLQQGCPALGAPTKLTVTGAICDPQFTVSWDAVAGAVSYSLDVSEDAGFASFQSFITSELSITLANEPPIPETLYLRVRGNSACGSSSWLSVRKTCGPEQTTTVVVSGIAKAPGYAPAFWSSDLSALNPGSTSAALTLTFKGNSNTKQVTYQLGAHQQQTWVNVLSSLFGLAGNDAGALTIESTQPVLALARTYSQTSPGQPTFGQEYLAQDPAQGLVAGEVGYLPGLRSDGVFYTNAEVVNVGTVATDVELRFFGSSGTLLKTESRSTQPGQRVSLTKVLPTGQASAFAEVRVAATDARVIAFASVVDDSSKDPTTVPLFCDRAAVGAHSYYVSGVARWPGFAPAFWYTDATALNPTDTATDLTFTFYGSGGTATQTRSLPAGQQLSFRDVLVSLFGLGRNDVGLLKVDGAQPVMALARTYSQVSPGQPTYGQGYVGYEVSQAIGPGTVAYLPGLRNDPPYYTNIELLNVGTGVTEVEVRYFSNAGTEIGHTTKTVQPNQRVGVSKVLPAGSTMAFAEVRVLGELGKVLANASVVDDLSKDPTTVPMMLP